MNAQKRMEEAISKQIYDRGHDRDHPDTDNLHGNFCGSHVGPVWKGGTSSGCSCKLGRTGNLQRQRTECWRRPGQKSERKQLFGF